MIRFPQALWLFLVLVPTTLVLWRRFKSGSKVLRDAGGRWRQEPIANAFLVKWFFSSFALTVFIISAVLALSEIEWGERTTADEPTGIDVVFVVDVSRSMLAQDILPSRLSRSANAINGIMDGLAGSRFGVVVFKGEGFRMIPLTEDTASINSFVNALKPNIITVPGTDIGAGIDQAAASFPGDLESQRFVILFSDGDSTKGDSVSAAIRAAGRDIVIHAVGVGGELGVPIPLGGEEYVTDAAGNWVETALNDGELRSIAEAGGGSYYDVEDPLVIGRIIREIRDASVFRIRRGFKLVATERYRLFLLISLISLFIYQGVRVFRWKNSY